MLTLMFSFGNAENSKSKMQTDCERMAVKLCSVRDYLQHRRIQTIPLVRLSLTYPENEMTPGQEGSGSGTGLTLIAPPDPSKSKESKSASKDPSQDVSLLQKFKNMIELKRESFEVEKRRKAARAMSSAGNNGRPEGGQLTTIQSPFDLLRKLSPSKSLDQGRGVGRVDATSAPAGEAKRIAEQTKEQTTTPTKKEMTSPENGGGKEEEDLKMNSNTKNMLLRRRMPLLNEIGRSKSVKSSESFKESELSGGRGGEKEVDGKKNSPSEEMPEGSAVPSLESVAQPSSKHQ